MTYEVQWCSQLPILSCGDCDIDNAEYKHRDFKNKTLAEKYAEKVLPKDCFGEARIQEFRMVLIERGFPGKRREYIGEPEFIS